MNEDAVMYLKKNKRMCRFYTGCLGCPLSSKNNKYGDMCGYFERKYPEESVSIGCREVGKRGGCTRWRRIRFEQISILKGESMEVGFHHGALCDSYENRQMNRDLRLGIKQNCLIKYHFLTICLEYTVT